MTSDRLYGHRWRRARVAFLAANPLCLYCERQGRAVAATVVDHIVPHKGDRDLFWSEANWQPLCKRCHDSIKAKEEHGRQVGCGADGVPLDAAHHWA